MRKIMLLAALLAMVVVAAVPAVAQSVSNTGNSSNGVSQSNEQDVQSGDVNQSFTVTGGGDNSNQCAGIQGVANTGNATNNTGVLQYANEDAEIEVDDSANFEISPSTTTTCKQQVNQAATASG